jgi:thiamine pyrophosphate-dependent acetolactate synthase large subunit-like protein
MSSDVAIRVSGAERLVVVLEDLGVEVVFGLPGVHNLPIWEALSGSPIRLVGVRHEQTAVYAADGYNRATGKLGVALVTTGPGAANTAGAMGEALASGSAVLLIATDIPAGLRREGVYRGVLHETRDQASIFGSIAKRADSVADAGEIAAATRAGAAAALAAPSGPVYLGIPTDLLRGEALDEGATPALESHAVDANEVARAAELIGAAERPLIWAGSGAVKAEAGSEVAALAEALGAPVITTYGARGLLPPDHPLAAPGPVHSPVVGELWDEADLVVAVGTDFDGMMTQNWAMPAPGRLVAVNVDAADATKNYPADAVVVGDAAVALGRIREQLDVRHPNRPEEELREIGAAVAVEVEADDPQAAAMLAAFEQVLPAEAVVVADMCIPGYWLAGYRRVPLPRKLAYPVGWGTLGFGFPASIGPALAKVGPTVCVCGDGGFLFACGELATIAQEELPLTVVIVDDGGYGMLRFDQEVAGSASFGVDLRTPDFVAMAHSFGIDAKRVQGFGPDFVSGLKMAIDSRRPAVLVVDCRLKPPPTTSPRWYRRAADATEPTATDPQDRKEP